MVTTLDKYNYELTHVFSRYLHLFRNIFNISLRQIGIWTVCLENCAKTKTNIISLFYCHIINNFIIILSLPTVTKSLSSKTLFSRSSGSQMAPPTVFLMSWTTSCRFGTKDGGLSFKYLFSASSPNHLTDLFPFFKGKTFRLFCFYFIKEFAIRKWKSIQKCI